MEWLIGLVGGFLGGNAAGAMSKTRSLGATGNSIVGALSGGLGGGIIQAISGGGLDFGSILAQLAGGGVIGGVVTALGGMFKGRASGTGTGGATTQT